ncbi:tRNA pseudouridine(55) synthase TruB [Geochorda subterranea]|uniref:tRNA pseudouridine(55) synthase TruB n=1 Tax=Geochorda subterranea TaxID=3109564 RepID=A0ABZ1BSY3_9FIRM|nr:tRNA pseudouridine(55) synthase TruB [Limnochorda sp. LNt]WRP15940.1 tRNA pseudouridine(55) synthase TruB [Limnochorda sp. LNt]
MGHFPPVRLAGEELRRAAHGTPVGWPAGVGRPADLEAGDFVRLYDEQSRFLGVARVEGEGTSLRLHPDRLLPLEPA